jgi:cytochrome c
MSSWGNAIAAGLVLLTAAASAQVLPGIGRPATAKELAAWDIDVRPDFKGLPKGSGSVARGQVVWESKCASCHGIFGESNEVFSPLVGGTTADDVKSGRVARLTDPAYPGRTTLMKVATVSTLWDYINRAMPWNAPKTLTTEEVYAVTAFVLNLGGIVPDDFVLSDQTMAHAQSRMPNRHGMTTRHGLWPGRTLDGPGKPDVKAVACMSQCATEPGVASMLPEFARDAHGNLAEQNRLVGAQRGADTTRPTGSPPVARAAPAAAPPPAASGGTPTALLNQHSCSACHADNAKLVGPSWRDIRGKHGGRDDAQAYLATKIKAGGVGVWGQIPMPPQALPDNEAQLIARWLAEGARK